jgi:hypothetical protein
MLPCHHAHCVRRNNLPVVFTAQVCGLVNQRARWQRAAAIEIHPVRPLALLQVPVTLGNEFRYIPKAAKRLVDAAIWICRYVGSLRMPPDHDVGVICLVGKVERIQPVLTAFKRSRL